MAMHRTPLLLLLDGILSQDANRTEEALSQIKTIVTLPPSVGSPLTSANSLRAIVEVLMQVKPELAFIGSDHDGSLPLHFAASIGNIPVARLLLNANRKAASTPNRKGKIPLHYAAREGRTQIVEFFMQEAPETAAVQSKKDKLALHFAAGEGHVGVVRALIRVHPRGASLPSKKGKVAIHFAARWGHIEVARELFKVAPDTIRTLDYEGTSAFHDAAREGQFEMMKFLVPRYPQGLMRENIRGETPLFPAVRSGNVDLVRYMVRVCPFGGRHVLQRVREDDSVHEWDPQILELCLRGAVNIWTEESEQHSTSSDIKFTSSAPKAAVAALPSSPASTTDASTDSSSLDGSETPPPLVSHSSDSNLGINLPRSKSPILEKRQDSKKRLAKDCTRTTSGNKRPRCGSADEQDSLSEWRVRSEHRSFHELHAALECGASSAVLNCILDRHAESQLDVMDELGRMPIHVALESPFTNLNGITQIVLDRIWKPNKVACFHRDYLGRLPLHHALVHRANPLIIQALLEVNPSSGVEHCDVLDARFIDKLPLDMALQCQCDLSTIYLLLRGDPCVVSSWCDSSIPST